MQKRPPSFQFAKLFGLDKNVQPSEYVLSSDICTLGRSEMCDVVIEQQKTISRLHAKIELDGPRYVLHDANSANGTFVNGHRIREPHLLKHDDVIGLGTPMALLRFNDPDPTLPVKGRLNYDGQVMMFFLDQQPLELTPNEFRLLHHLFQHAGDVCTRQSCSEAVWQREYDPGPDDENLDRTISNIRAKLRQIDGAIDPAEVVKTRRGLGYELTL